jgi:hypothetical protein
MFQVFIQMNLVPVYDNETDNYQQDHYQLHWNEKLANNWNTNLAFHYTKGKGFMKTIKRTLSFWLWINLQLLEVLQ